MFYLYLSIYVSLSIHLFIFIYLSIYPSIYLYIHLFIFFYPSIYLYLSIYVSYINPPIDKCRINVSVQLPQLKKSGSKISNFEVMEKVKDMARPFTFPVFKVSSLHLHFKEKKFLPFLFLFVGFYLFLHSACLIFSLSSIYFFVH